MTVVQRRPSDFEVISIALNTPAVGAGLEVGDRIVAVDGRPVTGMGVKDFNVFLYGATPFSVTVQRGRAPRILHIRPRELLAFSATSREGTRALAHHEDRAGRPSKSSL
jgi:C-terminal processing protease CtpA/Prc